MTHSQKEAVTALFDAIGRFDADAIAPLVTPDCAIAFPDAPVQIGPDGAARCINQLAGSHVDWRPVPRRIIGEGDVVAVEWTCTITDFGGSEAILDGSSIIDFRGDAIERARFYFRPEDTRQ